jgi:hypothetical protein
MRCRPVALFVAAFPIACTPSGSQPPSGNVDGGRSAITADDAGASSATAAVSVASPSLPAGGQTCPHDVSKAPGSSAHGMTIPTAHPRLWWTPERIARAKKWLTAHAKDDEKDTTINLAFRHVVAGADCSKPIQWLMGFTLGEDEWRIGSDAMRWNGEEAILVYDWCHDQLTADQKKTIVGRWNGYIDHTMAMPWGGPSMTSNNYYWGYLRNEMEWGIATYGDNPPSSKYLDFALVKRWKDFFLPFSAGTHKPTTRLDGRGGVPQEGTQYGVYMSNYPVVPFATASLLGRTIYDEADFFKGTVFYLLYATPPALTTSAVDKKTGFEVFSFDDDQKWVDHNSALHFSDFMAQAAMNWSCLPVGKYARGWSKLVGAKPQAYVASVDPGGEALSPSATNLPLDYYAPGPRYYYGRSAWGPGATVFHWQLGDYATAGVGHSHYDFGNWQIWRGGRWLVREATGYSDTLTGLGGTGTVGSGNSLAHNTLFVNGKGLAEPSGDGVDTGPAIVRRLESQPAYAYSNVDLSKLYRNPDQGHRDRDNPAAAHVEREFVFVRNLETTIIFDRIKSNAVEGTPADKIAKTFIAHFEQNPTIEDPSHVTYTSGTQAIRASILVPKTPETRVIDERKAKGDGINRLEVTTSGAAQSYFLTVLQAKDASAPALQPTVAEDANQFTVTLNPTTTVVFKKGETSAGGSITVAGATTNFRNDVQSIAITDAGPVWK